MAKKAQAQAGDLSRLEMSFDKPHLINAVLANLTAIWLRLRTASGYISRPAATACRLKAKQVPLAGRVTFSTTFIPACRVDRIWIPKLYKPSSL